MTETNPYQTPGSAIEPPADFGDEPPREPLAIGGWLILVAIGIVISPIRLAVMIWSIYVPVFTDGTWEALTTPGSEFYQELWAPILIFELVGNIGFLVAYFALMIMFFGKSSYFPKTYVVVTLINLCFILFDAWFATLVLPNEPMFDPDTAREVARGVVGTAIWVPYMLISERVKDTFVR